MEQLAFVNSVIEAELLQEYYPNAHIVRISQDSATRLRPALPQSTHLWIDPGVDGFHLSRPSPTWKAYISGYSYVGRLADSDFIEKPDKSLVQKLTAELLDSCRESKAAWISIPQLPLVDDNSRNRINKDLAAAAGEWKRRTAFKGHLVLPMIFTHQRQLRLKADRSQKLRTAVASVDRSGADRVWVVDASLYDQAGATTLQRVRFPALIALHQELKLALPQSISLAGPYWGMNLVLWTRGLIDIPVIGLGGSYQYHLTGGTVRPPKTRIALPPLRRWAVASPDLKDWLTESMSRLPNEDATRQSFNLLFRDFRQLQSKRAARRQLTSAYREWCSKIAALPTAGRALGLYQDLSSAYVTGKGLSELPKSEGSARRPERIAQQLMLMCL